MVTSPSYNPNGFSGVTDGDMVVLKIFDPEPSCSNTLSTPFFAPAQHQIKPVVAPNPTNGAQITIEHIAPNTDIRIFDVTGRQVQEALNVKTSTHHFSLMEVNSGTYYIVLQHKNAFHYLNIVHE